MVLKSDLQRNDLLKIVVERAYGKVTDWPRTFFVVIHRDTGSVNIKLEDFPGSPIKIGEPRFKTTIHLPMFHLTIDLSLVVSMMSS